MKTLLLSLFLMLPIISQSVAVNGKLTTSSVASGTFASLPAHGKLGLLYFCTDCPYTFLGTGNSTPWDVYLKGNKITLPVPSSFTGLNFTGSTLVTTYGAMTINALNSSSAAWVGQELSLPTPGTAYTSIIGISTIGQTTSGIYVRDSTSGNGIIVRSSVGSRTLFIDKWNMNTTSYNSPYLDSGPNGLPIATDILWFKIQDDGTNRIYSISADGKNYMKMLTTSNTDFISPDKVGFTVYSGSNTYGSSGTYYLPYTMYAFKLTTP